MGKTVRLWFTVRMADETVATRLRRRAVTIPAYATALVLLVGLAPILAPVLLLVDVARGTPLAATRLALFGIVFFAAELVGLLASALGSVVFVRAHARRLAWHYALQTAWARVLFGAARLLFRFDVAIDGDEAVPPGPVLVLARHVSLADTLLPAVFLAHRHGLRLRYVLKRELLWDPCLDVVGHRLPNAFVARGSEDSAREIARVRDLARGIGLGEGVLIYPEGTRFTPAKHGRALARVAEHDPVRHRRVRTLAHVLPAQLGGTLGLFDACPGADVLFLAHTGFEGVTTLRRVLDGALVGRTIRIAFWRVRAGDVPRANAERIGWLDGEWKRMDAWVGAHSTVYGSSRHERSVSGSRSVSARSS